ncbi:hypothetical protein WJX84_011637 [Apatococcus fuscideae]|uniref:AB hydrolase-1 domain-containing protein n=1 Tax=Apatococcus fuscideae TaxID=2026836 RepID=A0AAW1TFQ5_9CHLO
MPKAYLPLVARLRDRFTCYGVDLRGHGDSPSGPGTDVLHHGEDVNKVVRSLGLQGAYAFGHCLGGMAAVQAEIQQPGSFSQIICYEPILYHMNSHELGPDHIRWTAPALLKKVVARRQRYFASREDAFKKLSGKPPWNRFSRDAMEAYVEHAFRDVPVGVELKGDPANEADTMLWPPHLDPMHTVYPSLPEVKCPVSILAGTDVSATTPTEFIAHYIEDVVKEFPNARFERLDGLQHLGPLEDPVRVADCIIAHAGQAPIQAVSSTPGSCSGLRKFPRLAVAQSHSPERMLSRL